MITKLYRERRYTYANEWKCWFEPCEVIARTAKTITARSQSFSTLPDGGDFRLKLPQLMQDGHYHHSKAGKFWVVQPCLGDLFPSQQLLDTPDFVMQEAVALGWVVSQPIHAWEEWQKQAWMVAMLTKKPLAECVKAWRFGGQSAIDQMMADYRAQYQRRWQLLLEQELEED